MERVGLDGGVAVDLGEETAVGRGDGVAGFCGFDAEFLLAVVEILAELIGDVLEEGAAETDVEDLDSAADAEDRQIAVECLAQERELEGVAELADVVGRRVDVGVAVDRRIDVGAAAEEQTVEA